MQANPLGQRGRALEETYFRRLEADNLRRRRIANKRRTLSNLLQIDDSEVLDSLIEAGITKDNVAAFDFIPLLELIWADGEVDNEEQRLILDFAHSFGLGPGGPAFSQLEIWLTRRPRRSLFETWRMLAERGLNGRELGQRGRRGWAVTHALAVARSRRAIGAGSRRLREVAREIETARRAGADARASVREEAVA